jgi:hypothetical protein
MKMAATGLVSVKTKVPYRLGRLDAPIGCEPEVFWIKQTNKLIMEKLKTQKGTRCAGIQAKSLTFVSDAVIFSTIVLRFYFRFLVLESGG